jgi:hypothetical protein
MKYTDRGLTSLEESSMADDSEPAFPRTQGFSESISANRAGMSLRDYFAAKAMQGFCSQPPDQFANLMEVASQAYHLADTMLVVRGK